MIALVSLLFIAMIPIDCKITKFSLLLLIIIFSLYFFVFGWLICAYRFKRKDGWCTTRINYWNIHTPVRFVLSYVLSVAQQYKQITAYKASLQSIQPLWKIWRYTREMIWESHNALILAMSNSFHT